MSAPRPRPRPRRARRDGRAEGRRHDRRATRRLGTCASRPARPGSRPRAPATCSPARSAPWSRRRARRRSREARSRRPGRRRRVAARPRGGAGGGRSVRRAARSRRWMSPRALPRAVAEALAARVTRGSRVGDAPNRRHRSRVSRRAVLWFAFAVVHVMIAVLGFIHAESADGRCVLRLRAVVARCARGRRHRRRHRSRGCTRSSRSCPMVLAHGLAWIAGYEVAWALLVTAVRRARLRDPGRARPLAGRSTGAWFWLAYIALLGPDRHVPARRDHGSARARRMPVARRPALARLGAPGRRDLDQGVAGGAARGRRHRGAARGSRSSAGALVVSGASIARGVIVLGGGAHVFGFVTDQTDRGLQLEAPGQRVLPLARGRRHPGLVHLLRPRPAHLPGRPGRRSTS